MRKRKKQPAGLAPFPAVALAISLALPTLAEDIPWTYDTSGRTEPQPVTGEGTMKGLDAKARGFDDGDDITVDKWYWSMEYSNECDVDSTPAGMMMIIR